MDHRDFVLGEISSELDRLFATFDTKLLAAAMLIRSSHALRATHSAGVWSVADVRVIVEGATKEIYDPLPGGQVPKVATLGNGTLQ